MKRVAIDGRVCRAARGFLNWSTPKLACEADVPVNVVFNLERDRRIAVRDVERIEAALRSAGLELIVGVRRVVGIRSACDEPEGDG